MEIKLTTPLTEDKVKEVAKNFEKVLSDNAVMLLK